MKNITILIYDNCWAMSVFSVTDFFRIVTILEAHIGNQQSYNVTLVSEYGHRIKSACGVPITPHLGIDKNTKPDLVIIPPIEGGKISINKPDNNKTNNWLKNQIESQVPIISLTTGADILAATGLFESRNLCTHWAFVSLLSRKYPRINFLSHESFISDGNTLSTGSLNGTFDTLLAFIAQDKGDRFSQVCAGHLLVTHSSKITPLLFDYRKHTDSAVYKVQDWIESNFQTEINIEFLANKFGFSERNLKRRFVLATKIPPNKYMQKVRIDKAKKLLLTTTMTVKEISYNVGYENDSFLNKIFKKNTGVTLSKWRKITKSSK
jgi:transcriptional regulator GlxA family with amidase domain